MLQSSQRLNRTNDVQVLYNVKGVLSIYPAGINRLKTSDGSVTSDWSERFTSVDERWHLFALMGNQLPDFGFWPSRLLEARRMFKVRVYVKSAHSLVPSLTGRSRGQRPGSASVVRKSDPKMKPYVLPSCHVW